MITDAEGRSLSYVIFLHSSCLTSGSFLFTDILSEAGLLKAYFFRIASMSPSTLTPFPPSPSPGTARASKSKISLGTSPTKCGIAFLSGSISLFCGTDAGASFVASPKTSCLIRPTTTRNMRARYSAMSARRIRRQFTLWRSRSRDRRRAEAIFSCGTFFTEDLRIAVSHFSPQPPMVME